MAYHVPEKKPRSTACKCMQSRNSMNRNSVRACKRGAYHVPEEKPRVKHGPREPLVRRFQKALESSHLPVTSSRSVRRRHCRGRRWVRTAPLAQSPALDALAITEEAQGSAVVRGRFAPSTAREGELPDGLAGEEASQKEADDIGGKTGKVRSA